MPNKYRIGIDFHGVINAHPDFFREFIDSALSENIEIYIISGGPYDTICDYLKTHNIAYSKLWCIYDYYATKGEVSYYPDGSFHVDDNLWNDAKAEYCRKNNICVHIDDSSIYGRNFATPYCLFDEKRCTCQYAGTEIMLDNPTQALKHLLKICNND